MIELVRKKRGGGGTKRQAMWYDAPAASEVDV